MCNCGTPVPPVAPYQRRNEKNYKNACKDNAARCEHFFSIKPIQKYIFEQ